MARHRIPFGLLSTVQRESIGLNKNSISPHWLGHKDTSLRTVCRRCSPRSASHSRTPAALPLLTPPQFRMSPQARPPRTTATLLRLPGGAGTRVGQEKMELAPTRKDGARAQTRWINSAALHQPGGPCCHGDGLGRHAATMVSDEPMVNVISFWIETTSCKHCRFFWSIYNESRDFYSEFVKY